MAALADTRILLDCRWLGRGGAGRTTELLLEGLRRIRPAGRWTVWGPSTVGSFLWDSAEWSETRRPPLEWGGQRDLLKIPTHDVAIYMHQIRPLRPGASITMIYDTIPLHFGPPGPRRLKRTYLRAVGRVSSRILTVSDYSRRCIETDLGIDATRIGVVRFPLDRGMGARVRQLRERLPQEDVALYVGRFAPHKNLRALIEVFGTTEFRRGGGRLLLIGGSPSEVRELRSLVESGGHGSIAVEGSCPQSRLDAAYATSRLLVMPSMEEGFGLPVWEALACGLPVCVSDGGALPEITRGIASPFPARSVEAMAAAIDRVAQQPPGRPARVEAPTVEEFAGAFVEEVERMRAGST